MEARSGDSPGYVFSAGQVLEKIVGYDGVAAPPPEHPVWSVLAVPRPPGVRLLPSLWSPGRMPLVQQLPRAPVTLILQFKRPEYLYGASAAQWKYWQQPYFRFARSPRQQKVLLALERNIGADALVRYAAPALWQRRQLEASHLRRGVIRASGFVRPSQIVGHRYWTYSEPGLDGRPNPPTRPTRFETIDDLLGRVGEPTERLTAQVVPTDALGQYVERVGAAAALVASRALRQSIQRWQREVAIRAPEVRGPTVRRLVAMATLTSVVTQAGAIWVLLG
jgi:hypothetical protein